MASVSIPDAIPLIVTGICKPSLAYFGTVLTYVSYIIIIDIISKFNKRIIISMKKMLKRVYERISIKIHYHAPDVLKMPLNSHKMHNDGLGNGIIKRNKAKSPTHWEWV